MHRACGATAKAENESLQPYRLRHMAEARQKRAMHANNAAVFSAEPARQADLAERADAALAAANQVYEHTTATTTDDDSY